jgi:DNA methylase
MTQGSTIEVADALHLPLEDKSVDLVFGSPPYVDARLYLEDGKNLGISRGCAEWVEWMINVTIEALRVCRGPVCWVAAGVTRDRNYWPAVEGLIWECWRRGIHQYRPCYWNRVGIPGSGGDQWFRSDVEYVTCFKRPGKLPWSDNTAMGHPPKWGPGGEMSYRDSSGARRNQWGGTEGHKIGNRTRNGDRQSAKRPSHKYAKQHTKSRADGSDEQTYIPPSLANPGTLVKIIVGGGVMGDKIAHENEAPFPEKLAEHFIRSLCPPGGIVCDPFSGSGTTAKVATVHGRKFKAFDLRPSQVELTRRRVATVQKVLV